MSNYLYRLQGIAQTFRRADAERFLHTNRRNLRFSILGEVLDFAQLVFFRIVGWLQHVKALKVKFPLKIMAQAGAEGGGGSRAERVGAIGLQKGEG